MLSLIIAIFVLGYLAIALEHQIHVNKAASALLTGVLCWTVYALNYSQLVPQDLFDAWHGAHAAGEEGGLSAKLHFLVDGQLMHGFAETAGILFFLIGALVMFFIAQAAWPGMWNSINLREFFGVQGLFTVPTWPFRGLIVLGGVAGGIAYLAVFVAELRGMLTRHG